MKLRTEALDEIWLVTITRPEVRNCVDRETAEVRAVYALRHGAFSKRPS